MIKLSNSRPMTIYKLANYLIDLICRKCELSGGGKCPSQRCWLIEARAEIKREAKEARKMAKKLANGEGE